MQEKIMIIDSGSQYTQLIARRVRELNVYCEIYPFNKFPEPDPSVKGVILSGSPFFLDDPLAPKIDVSSFRGKLPLLGIGYGAQYLACSNGAEAASEGSRQYKAGVLSVGQSLDPLFNEVEKSTKVWLSTGENLTKLPAGFKVLASTECNPAAAFAVEGEKSWGVEFHPEVYHTSEGSKLMKNFVVDICGCKQNWTPAIFAETTIKELKEKLGSDKVLLGLSGGVDSSVAAMLLHKAIGSNLVCIFVDHGLLRKNEFEDVLESYKSMGLNVIGVRAGDKFLSDLKGITDPEQKRKIIGRDFIEVFDAEAQKLTEIKWLAQGTIYPDIIESVSVVNPKLAVKSHHNVGGLPKKMNLKLVEPLNLLFKDEVRRVGRELGVPDAIINRHPFPGPGLGVRLLGEITPERVAVLQNADKVFIDGLKRHGLYEKVWQAGVILLPVSSVGVKGEQRTYENAVALRAVASLDGMTADWIHLPYDFLAEISNEIIDKVDGVNRVVYDISSKPPATIEWE